MPRRRQSNSDLLSCATEDGERVNTEDQSMNSLVKALKKINHKSSFKSPRMNGTTKYVNYFISQFADIAEANEWNDTACPLHLRESFKGKTNGCGQEDSMELIFGRLRSQFGMSTREATLPFTNLKRDFKTTLSEHATEVKKLIKIAYLTTTYHYLIRQRIIMDVFKNTINNNCLQRHLFCP